MCLLQPFDDGQGLCQHTPRIEFECRYEALRIQREIVRRALFAFAQVMRAMLDAHALEIKGDPDAEGSAASEVSVQLHGMPVRATSRNDVDSTHKAYAVNFIGAWRGVEAAISAARTQANHQAPPPLRLLLELGPVGETRPTS